MSSSPADIELKARHRAMWASGDYPSMVETFLLPLGPRLVEACGIGPGMTRPRRRRRHRQRLDPGRRRRGAEVTASDLTPELLEAGRAARRGRGRRARVGRGRRREPAVRGRVVRRRHVVDRRDVRAPPPGGRRRARARLPPRRHDRDAELDARGHDRRAVPDDGAVRAAAPARRPAAAAVGQRGPPARAVRRPRRVRRRWSARCSRSPPSSTRATTASTSRRSYGPTIAARANASKDGREDEFDEALDSFCDEWNRGSDGATRASRRSTCSPWAREADRARPQPRGLRRVPQGERAAAADPPAADR